MSEEADGFGIYMEEACDSLSGIWAAFRPLAIQNHMPQGSMSMPNLDAQILENDRLLPLSFSVQKAVAIPYRCLQVYVLSLGGTHGVIPTGGTGEEWDGRKKKGRERVEALAAPFRVYLRYKDDKELVPYPQRSTLKGARKGYPPLRSRERGFRSSDHSLLSA